MALATAQYTISIPYGDMDWSNGSNLLKDTSTDWTSMTFTSAIDTRGIADSAGVEQVVLTDFAHYSTHMTFRAFIDASNAYNNYAVGLAMGGNFLTSRLNSARTDTMLLNTGSDDAYYIGTVIQGLSSGWSTITVDCPANIQEVTPFIQKVTNISRTETIRYHSAKLEYGDIATPWDENLIPKIEEVLTKTTENKASIQALVGDATLGIKPQIVSIVEQSSWWTDASGNIASEIDTMKSELNQKIDEVSVNFEDTADRYESWFKVEGQNSEGNPALTIGKRKKDASGNYTSDSQFSTQITNKSIAFLQNNQKVAEMNNNQLEINRMYAYNEIQIGGLKATIDNKDGSITWAWV